MRRFGQIIGVKPGRLDEYRTYHADVWPGVLQAIHASNIRNYSIFLHGDNTLFAYFEYVGDAFEADMAKMAADPIVQKWWAIMEPMQEPFPERPAGDWWLTLTELFHTD